MRLLGKQRLLSKKTTISDSKTSSEIIIFEQQAIELSFDFGPRKYLLSDLQFLAVAASEIFFGEMRMENVL